jgi:tetratricopeptide (TPR) repeat protein
MLRIPLIALLALSLLAPAFADDPKPQWQRMLTGDDAKKAAELEKRIAEFGTADKYADAIRLQGELLAMRTQVQGADHWETVNEKWALTALKKVAALPSEDRAGWRRICEAVWEADRLMRKADFVKAMPLFREWLRWHQQVLGEEHPDTAIGYNNVAYNLNAQRKYAEAKPLYQKALDINRKFLCDNHPHTAISYHGLAFSLNAQGKYVEATPLFQKALDIRRKVLGEGHVDTARSCNNVAGNLDDRGKYTEAGPLFQKALEINRKVLGEDHRDTATCYNNVAGNLHARGKYADATPLCQKALDIWRRVEGDEHPDTATGYNNVALNLDAQRQHAEAEPLYQKALEINRKVLGEDHPDTATSYNNVAGNLHDQGKYAEATPLYQKALEINRKVLGEDHPDTATSYNNVALNLNAQGKYAEAGPLIRKALSINRKVQGEDHPDTAISYSNVAFNLHTQGKYVEAIMYLDSAVRSYEASRLSVARGGLERASYGAERSPYPPLSVTSSREGRFAEAWTALEADLARGLLDEMASRRGDNFTPAEQQRRTDLVGRINPLNARILGLASRSARTAAESQELDQLIEDRKGLEKSLTELAVEASRREVTTLDRLQAALATDAAFISWVDVTGNAGGLPEHWGCVVCSTGEAHWERLPGSGPGGKWTKEEDELSTQFREALAKSASAPEIEALAKKLHAQRLAPFNKHLAGVKHLFVAPVNDMAGIPIEAITDKYTVSYTPSGTLLARLKDRERPRNAGFLAVGDPVFPPVKEPPQPTALPPGGLLITQVVPGSNAAKARLQSGDVLVAYAGEDLTSLEQLDKLLAANAKSKSVLVKVWREGQEKMAERPVSPGPLDVVLAKEPAREAITARRQTDQLLAKLSRGEDFAELPGTQVEIARLAGLFDAKNVTTLTRADASENRLEEMRKADKLKQFKYLHFATHGKANNFRSFDSALILTPPEKVPEPRVGEPWLDGRLTAAEVLDYWKLDAELVTLSACESALGRQGGGDGLLGFAQAFLLAGSRSVCLTLWEVDDTATVLLMDRFYRNLLGKRPPHPTLSPVAGGEGRVRGDGAKPMGKAAALHEAKQWLRNLSAKDALERLGTMTNGVVRGERPAREEMKAVPVPKDAGKDYKPYAHPRYWAAFILIGDPE